MSVQDNKMTLDYLGHHQLLQKVILNQIVFYPWFAFPCNQIFHQECLLFEME